jgi:MFS family permease
VIRDRSFLGLLVGEFISRLGSQFTMLALPWFVLVTTGSPTRMGTVFAVELLPIAIFGIPAGALVQKLGARTTMLISDAARVPIIAAVPLLHEFGGLSFGLILVIAALSGLFSTTYFTCQRVVIPAVVGYDERLIGQANSLIEGTTSLTNLAGPALAGVMIGVLGAANVMWFDAGSFALSFVIVLGFVRVARERVEPGEGGGAWGGLAYLRRDPFVARTALTSLAFGFLFPILFASFPVVAFEQYHRNARIAGWLAASFGGGAVLGAAAAYRILGKVRPLKLASVALLGLSLPVWVLVPHAPWGVGCLAMALVGFSNPLVNAPIFGLLATRVPPAFQPKVIQTLVTANTLAGPLGYVVAGPLFVGIGLHATYAAVATGALLASALFIHAVATYGANEAEPGEGSAQAA